MLRMEVKRDIMKTYQAPWGKALIVISCALVILSVASVVVWPMVSRVNSGITAWLMQWALPVLLCCCLPFIIRGYEIADGAILIRRLFWTTRMDLQGVKSAEFVPDAMSKSLRACGNGGAFSFTGWYWSKPLGFYRAYVTDLNRTVVLRYVKRVVVISPHAPEDFVMELNRVVLAHRNSV